MDSDLFSMRVKVVRGYPQGSDSTRKLKKLTYPSTKHTVCDCRLAYDSLMYPKSPLLNAPGKGRSSTHVDTLRSETTFISLTNICPTPHEGGDELIRHRGQE